MASLSCVICLEELTNEFHLLECQHAFHTRCIQHWFETQRTQYQELSCPLCRHDCSNSFPVVPPFSSVPQFSSSVPRSSSFEERHPNMTRWVAEGLLALPHVMECLDVPSSYVSRTRRVVRSIHPLLPEEGSTMSWSQLGLIVGTGFLLDRWTRHQGSD